MYNKVGKPLCELNNYFILTSELRVNSWHRLKHLSSLWGPAAVNSKAAVLLLLIHCCRYLTLFVGFLCCVFVLFCPSLCSVALLHTATEWSAVCYCGIL